MTTDQLRKIAEACEYEVRRIRGYRVEIGTYDCLVYADEPSKEFRPHLDANQAEACLNRRFAKDGLPVWTCERYGDKCTVYGLLDSWVEGEPADSFASAAMSAILESLK